MEKPFFTIVTITYNAEKTVGITLESVGNQSYKNYEYIAIDGASKDRTTQILKSSPYLTKYISEPDNGLYDAMNKGLKLATGEYIIFLNAGDALHSKDTLEKIVDSIGENRPDIIYGETALVDTDRNFIGMRRLHAPDKLTWKSFRMGMLVCHQAFIVRRELAPEYDTQYRFSADYDWCIRCMKKSSQIHNTHHTLIDYLNEGITTQNHKASLKERYDIMVRYYGRISVTLLHLWFAVRYYMSKWVRNQA
ncbi:glycosyltransferase family 2 protein [Coprobacter tertius]|uniref:Glycosyltransferase n=1 Tax=Coprobacter tertius TaxID=2944915 RepID=A0ABT1MD80_9BACT|nr:glycosyltransferase family 2 protein [Coprobacter tertius]MCP9610592.1 glycosyltransferase [Coprobacter tertius]